MNKYIKKNINGIICFSLITAIFFLCIAIIKNENKAVANNTPIPGDSLLDTSIIVPLTPPKASLALNYQKVMPKPPTPDDNYLFCQDICGIGNINLKAMHQTSLGLYVIATSECIYGDIDGTSPAVGIALLDTAGTIKSTVIIPTSTCVYISSQISALGIVVISLDTAKNQYHINIVNYNLDKYTTSIISSGLNARIVPTSSSFLIIVDYIDETIIYDYIDGKLKFYSLSAMSLVELFEYGNYYLLFSNTDSNYCITKVSKINYTIMEQTIIPNAKLISVKPAMDNGHQVFILIETSDATYAKKVASNLNFANATVKKLGNFTIKGINHSQDELLIIANGNINGLITLSYDLTVTYSDNNSSNLIKEIYQSLYYKGKYYYLATDQSNKLCLIKIADGNTNFSYLDIETDKACFAINTNDTLIMLYSGNYYEYISIHIKGLVI